MTLKRRSFLAGALTLGGLLSYSTHRGVRIPPLIWEPHALAPPSDLQGIKIGSEGLIKTLTPAAQTAVALSLRAVVPQPSIDLASPRHQRLCISVNNISPTAKLHITKINDAEIEEIEEITEGITRVLKFTLAQGDKIRFNWQIPLDKGYSFAAIGDTGGQQELRWCLQRAHQLGALFMLHLGDFYYTTGDYESSIDAFNSAPLPCYVSIGNHDFHDGNTRYRQFLNDIGPLNNSFTLGGARFINVDTASNILPYGAGPRGALLKVLAQQTASVSNIAFSHRPLFDPQHDSSHDIGSKGEADWLVAALTACEVSTLLSGHIHIHQRKMISGIDNIIVGQGLGHQDLITNQDYSKMALGSVNTAGQTTFEFPSLAMPWEMHCHPRSDITKQSLKDANHVKRLEALERACAA